MPTVFAHPHSPDPLKCRHSAIALLLAASVLSTVCGNAPPLTQLLEARRLAAALQVEFTKASDASNRAVMSDTDDASAAAAGEARQARQIVERDLAALQPILQSLGYTDDLQILDRFKMRFAEYRTLDDEILPLAVENTNLKAQRLSFGPARQAADSFRTAVNDAVRAGASTDRWHAEALAAKAVVAVLEIQALHAPHIAESDDAAMTRMEEQMAASDAAARKAVEQLKEILSPAASAQLAAATAALVRFKTINGEILALSRRNSNVRSLALTLGRKRVVAAECSDQLAALEQALAKHEFSATR